VDQESGEPGEKIQSVISVEFLAVLVDSGKFHPSHHLHTSRMVVGLSPASDSLVVKSCLPPLPAFLLVALILVAYYDMAVAGVAAHPGMVGLWA